jgi:D-amino-acid dehydrogenase
MDPRQWAWGLRFLAACRAGVANDTTSRLLTLAAESRAGFERMLQQARIEADFSAAGKLVLYPDSASFDAARRQLDLQRRLGGQPQAALSPAQCVEVEPALCDYAPRIAGGIHTPSECVADCRKVCEGLYERLRAAGVRFELGRTALGWVHRGRRVVAVRTDAGEIAANAFVLSAGTASTQLARLLGLRVPVYPLKGYGITLPVAAAPVSAPRVSVTDVARKVVFARLGERLRVAGMIELVGEDLRIQASRIASLLATTRDVFPGLGDTGHPAPWSGLRPATPTGLPLLGRMRGAPSNLMFNTGHGALGFTLAMGSAERVASQLRQPG